MCQRHLCIEALLYKVQASIQSLLKCVHVYDVDDIHVYALQIENASESDPRSYEATKSVAKKAQKKILRLPIEA